jgi:membrane protein DedA with SNARE-associated domain
MARKLGDTEQDLFQPLRPAKGTKFVMAAVIGPVAWVIAWLVAAWLIERSDAIEFGLLMTTASFVFAVPVLGLLAWGRAREERRFEQARDRREDRA